MNIEQYLLSLRKSGMNVSDKIDDKDAVLKSMY